MNANRIGQKIWASLLMLALVAVTLSQQKTQRPTNADDDVIRTNTNVVQVDAVVTDKNGKVVTDLGIDDFEIIEEGKPVKAEYFSFVPLTEKRSLTSPKRESTQISQPTAQELKRTFVFLVDNPVIEYGIVDTRGMTMVTHSISLLTRAMRAALEAEKVLRWFVDTEMTSSDLVAISETEVNIGVLRSFTNDPEVLNAAIDRIRNSVANGEHNVISLMSVNDERHLEPLIKQNLQVIATVDRAVEQISNLPGRKIVTLLSRGMLYDPRLPGSDRVREKLTQLAERCNRAHVTLYTLSPNGLGNLGGVSVMAGKGTNPGQLNAFGALQGVQDIDGLVYLAKETGGRAIYGTNDTRVGFAKILEENSGYYVLGYNPGPEALGRPHKIKVTVKRPGLKVQARTTAFATPRLNVVTSPQAALNLPTVSDKVKLELTPLYISPDGKKSRLVSILHVDLHGLSLTPETDRLDALLRITGPDGTIAKEEATQLVLRKGISEREINEGIVSVSAIEDALPGFYRVSAAVTDPKTGATGSITKFVEIANPASGRLSASSLIVSKPKSSNDDQDETASMVQRRFTSNGQLNYDCVVYNSGLKGTQKAEVQVELVIKKGSSIAVTAPARTITGDSLSPLTIGGTLTLPGLPPGTYSLEISLIDPHTKDLRIVRSASFQIVSGLVRSVVESQRR